MAQRTESESLERYTAKCIHGLKCPKARLRLQISDHLQSYRPASHINTVAVHEAIYIRIITLREVKPLWSGFFLNPSSLYSLHADLPRLLAACSAMGTEPS